MRKLYFKKLISILGHLALCLIIYWLGITFISIIANFFKNWFVRFCIGFGIPLTLVLIRVFNRRADNQEMRRAYLAEANRERLVFGEEWHRICNFSHFRAEVLAFATIAFVATVVFSFFVIPCKMLFKCFYHCRGIVAAIIDSNPINIAFGFI